MKKSISDFIRSLLLHCVKSDDKIRTGRSHNISLLSCSSCIFVAVKCRKLCIIFREFIFMSSRTADQGKEGQKGSRKVTSIVNGN